MTNHKQKTIINDLTQDELQSNFRYVKSTGKLYWKPRTGKYSAVFNSRFAGQEAGWLNPETGYTMIHFKGRPRMVHRLIWTLLYGPTTLCIDHINSDKSDNRLKNLRLATHRDNSRNRGKTRVNTTGFKGVTKSREWFIAQIGYNGKTRRLGQFETAEMAHAAYCGAAKLVHGEFFRAQ